ncbi:hypothetical protein N5J06_20760 [Ralstonia sp. CHL-2022]|uniref:Lipoprotein n=1 Tax=Ralstonia mojiangensis TaxID=2953895 RepID=A0AAE3I1H3_9RALS|nr:hypothetical protein [Ralstonia mojiangensis]MCT7295143.1 hypothetical protein [Ralstonia mojiangensis]MCT7313414.1 hypothetical protein [Ralstonia mojiangensis]MCT7315990.1 hypothetical protein [Ralstonia mojiangensis]
MKRLAAAILVGTLCLVALAACATSCEGGSNRGVFCGAGTRF